MTTIKVDENGTRELTYYDKAIRWRNQLQDDYIAVGNNYKVYPSVDDNLGIIIKILINAPLDEQRMITVMLATEVSRGLKHLKQWMDKFNKDSGYDQPIRSFYYDR